MCVKRSISGSLYELSAELESPQYNVVPKRPNDWEIHFISAFHCIAGTASTGTLAVVAQSKIAGRSAGELRCSLVICVWRHRPCGQWSFRLCCGSRLALYSLPFKGRARVGMGY